jgi:hypothetical protein
VGVYPHPGLRKGNGRRWISAVGGFRSVADTGADREVAPEAAINEEPSECVSLPYSDELTPNARGEPRPRAGARHERGLLGVGSSAWFGVQGGNRAQRAALLPSGSFSLYASYFPVE